jgi:hypothetical protein
VTAVATSDDPAVTNLASAVFLITLLALFRAAETTAAVALSASSGAILLRQIR